MAQALQNNLIIEMQQFEKTVDFVDKKPELSKDFQNLLTEKTSKESDKQSNVVNKEENVKNVHAVDKNQSAQDSFVEKPDKKQVATDDKVENNINPQNTTGINDITTAKDSSIDKQNPTQEEKSIYDSVNSMLLNLLPLETNNDIDNTDNTSNDTNNSDNDTISTEENTLELVIENVEDNLQEGAIDTGEDLLPNLSFGVVKSENVKSAIETVEGLEITENVDSSVNQNTAVFSKKDVNTSEDTLLVENNNEDFLLKEIDIASIQENENKNVKIDDKNLSDLVDEEVLKELKVEEYSSETSSDDTSSNLMQNQTPEEQGVKIALHAEFEMQEMVAEQKITHVSQVQQGKMSPEANPSKILEQISKQLENLQHNSKVNIVLNPEALGKVTIQLVNTKEGLSAQLTCATQEARNILMKGLDGLKETLIAHGVNVDNVTVNHEMPDGKYQSDWTEQEGSRGGNKQQKEKHSKDAQREFEQAMFNIENEENGNV